MAAICIALQAGGDLRVAVDSSSVKARVGEPRCRAPRLAVGHRDLDDGDLGVRHELRRELGEVLGDEDDDVVALLDLAAGTTSGAA